MATKDWKKVVGKNLWEHKKKEKVIIILHNENYKDYPFRVIKARNIYTQNMKTIKIAKTKLEAHKWVMAYMRKN